MCLKPCIRALILIVCLAGAGPSSSPAYAAEPIITGILAFPSQPQALMKWQPLAGGLKQAIPERDFELAALRIPEQRLSPFDAAPRFTWQDVWIRYYWQNMGALLAGGMILLLGVSVLRMNRRLAANHLEIRMLNDELEEKVRARTWQLLESQALLSTVFDSVQVGIVLVDAETRRFRMSNPSFQRLLGYSAEEILELGVADIHPKEEMANVNRQIACQIKQEYSLAPNMLVKKKDGATFFADINSKVMRVKERSFLLAVFTDITARRQAEQALQHQFHLLQVLLDAIPAPVFHKDTCGVYTGCNQAFAAYLGREKAQIVGKSVYDMAPKELAETYHRMDLALLEEQGTQIYESAVVYADGTQHNVIFNKAAFNNLDGSRGGLVGVILDITAAKRVEELLRFKNTVLSILQQTSPSAILVVDENARIVSCNEQFIKMWTLPEEMVRAGIDEPVLRKVCAQLVNPAEFLARVRYLYEHKTATSRDELRLVDGRIIDRHSAPIADADGRYYGRVWDFRDITELKRATEKIGELNTSLEEKIRQLLAAQEDLLRKEKLALLGQVAGSVGHELRNPLAVMNNAVYFLKTRLADADETTREYLEIIKNEIAGAERIVSDLLDAVRTKPPQSAAVSVRELLNQTLRKVNIPATLTLSLDLPETLPWVRVDALQIQQVLRNLINNGLEAMAAGGALCIRALENRPEGTVTLSVADSGSGIAPEMLDKLFQPLFTTKARGIGLGLVVVKNLIEANGGRVGVESVPGEGSRFSVTLPRVEGDAG